MSKSSFYRNLRKKLKRRHFQRSGMKPWTRGYDEFKTHEIARVLGDASLSVAALPPGFGFRLDERIVEYPWLFSRLPAKPGFLLDAGSTLNFEFLLEHPLLKDKKIHICTLAPEGNCFWERGVSYLYDDLRDLPYRDGWFDWVVSISTLEHVGMNNSYYTADAAKHESQTGAYLGATRELWRVLKPGGVLYASVPFGKAANLGWYQVFDQVMVNDLIAAFNPKRHSAAYYLYHPDGWRNSTADGAANATVFDIHRAKGYDPDFAAAARAVCCLELIK